MRNAFLGTTLGLILAPLLAAQSAPTQPMKPGPLPREPVHFVAIGDYGTTNPGSFAVAALVHALDPGFVITLGDNNYPSGSATTIDQNIGQHYHDYIHPYLGSYGAGAATRRFFPSLGNHDWLTAGALPYLSYFALNGNERYYEFRRGSVHLFALDSDPAEPDGIGPDSIQAQWLEQRLAASRAAFKVVYLHHAPYCSSSVHGSHGELQWPFREWGASLVLTGHDHLYERMSVSGFPYFVNGLGGNARYAFGTPIGGSELRFNAADGALDIRADGQLARIQFVTTDDVVVDSFTLPKGGIDPGQTLLIGAGGSWRFLDTGIDPGPSWTTPGFDDSAWGTGNAELGYGDGDEVTTVGFGGVAADKYITTWFRSSFTVADPSAFGQLQFRLLYDDGAVVHVNGTEVARVNLPGGAITASTLASAAVSGDEESTFFPFTFDPSLLVAGTNVIAVEVHQSAANSSDISFALELVGLGAGTTLLARGSNWSYLDTGLEPGATWKDPGFDDSGWAVGPAQVGYGEGDEATVASFGGDPQAKHPTTWLRTTFSVTQAASIDWLACRLLRDDGVLVYVNGTEAARFNLPRTGVGASTLAGFDVAGADENLFQTTSLDPRLLVDGTNTIAVELHQASATSDDLSFDLELVAH